MLTDRFAQAALYAIELHRHADAQGDRDPVRHAPLRGLQPRARGRRDRGRGDRRTPARRAGGPGRHGGARRDQGPVRRRRRDDRRGAERCDAGARGGEAALARAQGGVPPPPGFSTGIGPARVAGRQAAQRAVDPGRPRHRRRGRLGPIQRRPGRPGLVLRARCSASSATAPGLDGTCPSWRGSWASSSRSLSSWPGDPGPPRPRSAPPGAPASLGAWPTSPTRSGRAAGRAGTRPTGAAPPDSRRGRLASSAGSISASAASCIDQDPSACAARTAARPASVMRPSAISRSTRSLFERAQPLPGRRGVSSCAWRPSSSVCTSPSIQPKQSASSTIASYANRVPAARLRPSGQPDPVDRRVVLGQPGPPRLARFGVNERPTLVLLAHPPDERRLVDGERQRVGVERWPARRAAGSPASRRGRVGRP